jgi:hypothetical protein
MLPLGPGPVTDPKETARSESARFPTAPILKIREELLPLISNTPSPSPIIVRVFEIGISPVVNVMMAGGERLNMMVSPEVAVLTASLSDPAPLSAVLVTARTEKALARRVIKSVFSVHRAKAVTVAHTARRLVRIDFVIGSSRCSV